MTEESSVFCRVKSSRAVIHDAQKEMMTGMIALVSYSDIEHYKDGWIWYPFIPRKGITLLLGAPGTGKSMFLMQIIAVLTGAGTFPDGIKPEKPMTVIYQCSDDGLSDTVKPRLTAAGADCNKVVYIKDPDNALTLNDGFVGEAMQKTGCGMFVFDSYRAYVGDNWDDKTEREKMLRELNEMVESNDCAVVLVGYTDHSNSDLNDIYIDSGCEDIASIAKSVLLLSADAADNRKRRISIIKTNSALKSAKMSFELGGEKGFKWID